MTLPLDNVGSSDNTSINKTAADNASQTLSESLGPDDWSKLSIDEQKQRLAQVAAIGANDTPTIPGAREQWTSQTPAEQAEQNRRMYQAASQFPVTDGRANQPAVSEQAPPVAPNVVRRDVQPTQTADAGYDKLNSWLTSLSNDRAQTNYYGQNPARLSRPQDAYSAVPGQTPDVLPPVGLPAMPGQINAPDANGYRRFPLHRPTAFEQTAEQGGLSPIQQMQGMRPEMLPPQMRPNARFEPGTPGNVQLVPVRDAQGRTFYVPSSDLVQPQSMQPAQPGQMGTDQSAYIQQQQMIQYEQQQLAAQRQQLAQQMQYMQQMQYQQQMRYNPLSYYGGYGNPMGMMGYNRFGFGGGGLGTLAMLLGGGFRGGMRGGGIMNFLRYL